MRKVTDAPPNLAHECCDQYTQYIMAEEDQDRRMTPEMVASLRSLTSGDSWLNVPSQWEETKAFMDLASTSFKHIP